LPSLYEDLGSTPSAKDKLLKIQGIRWGGQEKRKWRAVKTSRQERRRRRKRLPSPRRRSFQASREAVIVIFALSTRETGQLALASAVAISNASRDAGALRDQHFKQSTRVG
jgi:hypothetical protein